ncbi:MAG: SH3 domain-containing protein [Byssovorax sp.]
MSSLNSRWISLAASAAIGSLLALSACSAAPGDPDSTELVGASETVDANNDALTGSHAAGSKLVTTANLNLRTGPSTNKSILHVIPEGAEVTLLDAAPQNGFYHVKHDGTTGWSYGAYLKLKASGGGGSPGGGSGSGVSQKRTDALERAKSAVGFSYWWGHGRFRPEGPSASNAGSCSGSCPSCSHSGSYGGDCSGLAGKVWQVPASNSTLTDDDHPYSTVNFDKDTSQWSTVSRSNVEPADAMVYNENGHGHIFIYSSGDGWGSMHAYECKGCSYGCVYNSRTASSAYHAIRRSGY